LTFSLRNVDLDDLKPSSQDCPDCRHGHAYEKHEPQVTSPRFQAPSLSTYCVLEREKRRLEERLRCRAPELYACSLRNRFHWGDYIALSYVWGEPHANDYITIDGCIFPVTRNLYVALQALWPRHQRYLGIWVDAVCINQRDLEERAREVKKMDMIYSQALIVRGWIGACPSDAATVRHFHAVETWLDETKHIEPKTGGIELFDIDVATVDVRLLESIWMVAAQLFVQSYWQRLWIIQELLLAKSKVLWYGEWHFSWLDIWKLAWILGKLWQGGSFSEARETTETLDYVVDLLHTITMRAFSLTGPRPYGMNPNIDLSGLLFLSRTSNVTDPRDKVYGLLALLPAEIHQRLQNSVSYHPDVQARDVCATFSKACALSTGGLDTIARFGSFNAVSDHLPSWSLDLGMVVEDSTVKKSAELHRPEPSWSNNHNASLHLTSCIAFSKDGTTMLCSGAFVDVIATTNKSSDVAHVPQAPSIHVNKLDSDPPVRVTEDKRLALSRTILRNTHYEFTDGPSPLDMPWVWTCLVGIAPTPSDQSSAQTAVEQTRRHHLALSKQDRYLDRCMGVVLFGDGTFPLNGHRLHEYFAPTNQHLDNPTPFVNCAHRIVRANSGNCLCTTETGRIGLVPLAAVAGDLIAVLFGCREPVVLRHRGDGYQLVGRCFVDGLMRGEVVPDLEAGKVPVRTIGIC
jgi:hypothetical protein